MRGGVRGGKGKTEKKKRRREVRGIESESKKSPQSDGTSAEKNGTLNRKEQIRPSRTRRGGENPKGLVFLAERKESIHG